MIFVVYDGAYKSNRSFGELIKVIYENFVHLSKYPELNHNIATIKKNINSNNKILILCFDNNYRHLLGYLLGYDIVLNDGRYVMFISYVYVSKHMRSRGIGKKFLHICFKEAEMRRCEGIMLTCDTDDNHVMKFYENMDFMLDFNLRRYAKYDVLYRVL